jgi:hypothetical protein
MIFKLIKNNPMLIKKSSHSKIFKYYNFFYLNRKLDIQINSITKGKLPLSLIRFVSFNKLDLREYMILKYTIHSLSKFLLWVDKLPFYRILFLSKNIDSFEVSSGFRVNLLKFFSVYSKIFRNYFLVNKVFIEKNYFKEKNLLKMYTIETPSVIFKNLLIIKNLNS